jgi:TolA-binding protein
MKSIIGLYLLLFAFNAIAQKTDVRVEISTLKSDVSKLQTELSTSNSKNESRIVDLGAKIEDLRFEINVLKKIVEQYRNGEIKPNSNSTTNTNQSDKSSSAEESLIESKPQKQSYSQCSATTKKGTRCSRSARSNGLCWQHGG